jgi:ApeA N-terminal domain 1
MRYRGLAVDDLRKSKNAGQFTLVPGKEIYGELTFAGPETLLYLYDRQEFETQARPHQYITGLLQDFTRVSLIDCVTPLVPGHGGRPGEEYYFADVFPHFIVYGDSFLAPNDKTITKVHFVIDDATTLFYDFDAFGMLIDSKPFIDQLAAANSKVARRTIETGPAPRILYFTGKREIFSADTVIGKVSASHNPIDMTWGGRTESVSRTQFF